nr:TonB-dependent receptor [Prevotella sp.]
LRESKKVTMLGIRVGWGLSGSAPRRDYLYTSKYGVTDTYIDMNAMRPLNIRLNDLQWETASGYNLALELGLWDDRLKFTLEAYHNTTNNMLSSYFRIPSNSGYTSLDYKNDGKMRNVGWEFHINTNKLIKKGDFQFDLNANFGNNKNEILEMDPNVLNNLNIPFKYDNAQVLQRVQLHNPFGAIYGFRYKGVYQYNYDTFADMNEEQRSQFITDGKTAPVAMTGEGNVILDDKGQPVRMQFGYSNDPSQMVNYKFSGGDAIYEDINHDGNINALDIVYLGSSLPKLTGGFGFTASYSGWRLMAQFTYRVGNKILNMARLNTEAMIDNKNQSQAVNYRWRKEGDVTSIPRAMYGGGSNYNTLVSDRFVEDGTYLRMGYIQLSYSINKKHLKWIGLNRISLYGSANNPFVLTKYTGVDPDISTGGWGPATDNAQTPRARSYTLGVTVDF